MKQILFKYGLVMVLAAFASIGLLRADSIVNGDSTREVNDTICINRIETKSASSEAAPMLSQIDANSDETSHREWLITLISTFAGAILGYLLIRLNERRQARIRKEQYVKEIQLLTEAVIKHTEKCNKSIDEYIKQLRLTPHEIHGLRQGILVAIERITKLDATMVYEAFESKGKQDDFDDFLNLTDQLLTAYTHIYKDFEVHTDAIVKTTNEFEELSASVMYECQSLPASPAINNILIGYTSVHPENNQNPFDIKLEYDTLIAPIKAYLGQNNQIPINNLWRNADKADFLYRTICGHQMGFANELENRLGYINQTIEAIEKIKL